MPRSIALLLLTFLLLTLSSGSAEALPPCPDARHPTKSPWLNCFGTYAYPDGSEYRGEFQNDKRHGRGTFIFFGDRKNSRDYLNGKGSGWRSFTDEKWNTYVGEFRNNRMHGRGTLNFANGDRYVGEFRDNRIHGRGIKTGADGEVKEGIWENNQFRYAESITQPQVNQDPPEEKQGRKTKKDELIYTASGSGFAISAAGHIITNHHVIDGCQTIKIHYNGRSKLATLMTFDLRNDVALLKGDFKPTTILPLSKNDPELLQDIYVAGFPFGRGISTTVKVTKGIVSSLTGIGNNFSNIQIDAALQPGNSGGPIISKRGNVVGVAVAKLDMVKILENFGTIPENTNFGIKASVIKSITGSMDIPLTDPNESAISKAELARNISGGTYYLSCWMTRAQIDKARSRKVLFRNLD